MRRQSIRVATARLLETVPYYELTLEAITDAVGLPTSVFYHYFPSKRALLLDLIDELFAEFRREMGRAGPYESLEVGVAHNNRLILGMYRDHTGLMRCLAQVDELALAARWREHLFGWRQVVGASLREYADPGTSQCELDALAHTLSGVTESFAREYFVERNVRLLDAFPDTERAADFLTAIWIRTILLTNPVQTEVASVFKKKVRRVQASKRRSD